MIVCRRPFNYIYFDHFDGKVWFCPWMKRDFILGNLFQIGLEELWMGEKARQIRSMLACGDYSGCRREACPFLQNRSFPKAESIEAQGVLVPTPTPERINLAHDFLCNQYCETCRKAKFRPQKDYPYRVRHINKLAAPWLDKASFVSMTGHGDPFASPYTMELLHNMRPVRESITILLETNGVYFDERHWNTISHLAAHNLELMITINSFDPFVYKHISLGGNYERLVKNLALAKKLRQKNAVKKLHLCMVIQDRNFREIPSFIQICLEKYACDYVSLRPVYQWGTMPEDVFWFKDVLNPMHPYHQEYLEIISHPLLSSPQVYHYAGSTLHEARPFPGHSLQEKTL
jgi:hypothetical protein